MPAILNCLDESNECTVGGNTFSFKPGQLKYFSNPNIASVIDRVKGDEGFILLPESLEHLSHLKEELFEKVITPEEKKLLADKKAEGINRYCTRLRRLIFNATVSLQKDIDRAGYKYDARTEATEGDLKNLQKLAQYQVQKQDLEQQKLDKFKELEKQVKPRG